MASSPSAAIAASHGSEEASAGNRIGIWIDTEKACIIRVNGEVHTVTMDTERHKRILKAKHHGLRGGSGPSRSEKHERGSLDDEMRRYLNEVMEATGTADRIVVFGPAYVKNELGKALANDARFQRTELELVTADRMTPNQMVAWVKRYFHH